MNIIAALCIAVFALFAMCIDIASYIIRFFRNLLPLLLLCAAVQGLAQVQGIDVHMDTVVLNQIEYTGSVDTLFGAVLVLGPKNEYTNEFEVVAIAAYCLGWKRLRKKEMTFYTLQHRKIPAEKVLLFKVLKIPNE